MRRNDTVMFFVAFVLLILFSFGYVNMRSQAGDVEQSNDALQEQIADREHYIRVLQGKLNACRADQGLPEIEFTKY